MTGVGGREADSFAALRNDSQKGKNNGNGKGEGKSNGKGEGKCEGEEEGSVGARMNDSLLLRVMSKQQAVVQGDSIWARRVLRGVASCGLRGA